MGHGDDIPGNASAGIDLNTNEWILIGILIALVIFLFIVAIFVYVKSKKEITKLQELNKTATTDEERNLLLKYRELNSRDKTVINNTLKTLSENSKNNDTHTAGN